MKSKKHLILLIIFLSSFRVFARLEAENLKEIDLLKPEFQYLSPTKGYVWSQSGALENFAEIPLEPELLDLQKFILYFFYRANSDDFSVSGSETGISLYLNPEKIGQLLGFFAMQKNQDFKGFDNRINLDQLSTTDKKLYYKAKEKETFWRRYLIKKEIINNKLVNSIEDLFFKHKEDNKFYAVLLSLLWQKAVSKQEILLYYKGLQKYLGDSIFSEKKGLAVIKNSSLPEEGGGGGSKEDTEDRGVQEAWLSSKFVPSDIEPKPEASNLEGSLYWIFVNSRTKNSIPLETGELAYPYGPNGFPDCGEMTLKNFIKLILDKSKRVVEGSAEGDYDTRILDSLNAHPDVKEFFKKFNTRELQKTQEARNEWGRITCKRDGVRYFWSETGVRNPNIEGNICEINAGRSNMLTLLNRLFQTPPSLYSQVSELFGLKMKDFIWEEFFQKIKEARQKVWGEVEGDFSVSKWEGDTRYGVEQIGKYRLKTSHFSEILWEFQPSHFHMEEMASARLKDFSDWKSTNALDIYALYPTDSKKIGRVIKGLSENYWTKYFLKLSGDMIPNFFKTFNENHGLIRVDKEKLLSLVKVFNNLTTERGRASNNEDLKRRIKDNLFLGYVFGNDFLNYEALKNLYNEKMISRDVFTRLLRSQEFSDIERFEKIFLEIIEKKDPELLLFLLRVRRSLDPLKESTKNEVLSFALESGNLELVRFLFEEENWLIDGAKKVFTYPKTDGVLSSEIANFVVLKIKSSRLYERFSKRMIEDGNKVDRIGIILNHLENPKLFSDSFKSFLLDQAIQENDLNLVTIMLEKKFPTKLDYSLNDPSLLLAFKKNNIEIATAILESEVAESVFYRDEESPLSLAIQQRKEVWVDLLLKYKAFPSYTTLSHEKIKTLFSIFKEFEKKFDEKEVALAQKSLFSSVVRSKDFFTYEYFKETLYKDGAFHELAQIILLEAEKNDSYIFDDLLIKMVKEKDLELLSLVPNLKSGSLSGSSAFLKAVEFENTEIVQLLLSKGADPSAQILSGGGWKSALSVAFQKNNLEIGKLLLEGKSISSDASRILSTAIAQGKLDWVHLLLGYKVSARNIDLFQVAEKPDGLSLIEALVREGGRNINEKREIFGETLLSLATKNQEIEKIKKYLELGADPSMRIRGYDTPTVLQYAIENGQEEIVDEFLKYPTKSLVFRKRDESPSYHAMKKDRLDILKKILEASTEEFPGYHPADIFYAASKGSEDSLGIFHDFHRLKKINTRDNTPLFLAIQEDQTEALFKLLEFDFDVDGRNSAYDATPFEYAISKGKYRLAESLSGKIGEEFRFKSNLPLSLAFGVMVPKNLFNFVLEKTDEDKLNLHVHNTSETLLIQAIKIRDFRILEDLLNRNANPNIQDSKGKSALIHAVERDQEGIVEMLLQHKADPTLFDQTGMSALHYAAMKSDSKILNLLLTGDVSPNVYKEKGVTPLFLAAKEGRVESIKALIGKGADVNFLSTLGKTPLTVAIKGNHKEAVEILLSQRAEVNLKTNIPPLVIAIKNENREMIDLLLSHNIDVDIGSSQGEFPLLEILLSSGSWAEEVSKKIAERAKNINILSAEGFFPLTLSENRKFEETSQILKEKEAFHNSHFVEDGSSLVKKLKAKDPSLLDKLFQEKINFAFVERDLFTLVLFYFIDTKEEEILQRFIQEIKDADLNFKYKGETLLMRAAKKGRFKIVQALLEARVDIRVVDSAGKSAAQIALENNKFGVFKELLKAYESQKDETMYEILRVQHEKVKNAKEENEQDYSEDPSHGEDAVFEDDSEDDWEPEYTDEQDNWEPDPAAGWEPVP
jgi:ankyrin repeat protein